MPAKQSAVKALRQSAVREARNRGRKRAIKETTRTVNDAIQKKEDSALKSIELAVKAIDKAVQKGALHANTGARKKSRLMKRMNTALKK